jgi:glutamate synthase (NADPH) small chain
VIFQRFTVKSVSNASSPTHYTINYYPVPSGRKVSVICQGSAELGSPIVKFIPSAGIDKEKPIDDFSEEGFDAVYMGVSFEMDTKMEETPGTDLFGVYEATDFLIRANADPSRLTEDVRKPFEIGKRVVVIGGGDIAFDCLRTALRLGSEDVTCLCNCTENELPNDGEVTRMAREEGAKYRFLTQPVKFIAGADGKLAAVECVEMKLDEPDAQGRRNLVPVEGSNFSVAADTAIISTQHQILKHTIGA